MLGEYVVRIYDQVCARPFYLIDRTVNIAPNSRRHGDANHATDDEQLVAADAHEQLLAETEELLELMDESRGAANGSSDGQHEAVGSMDGGE